MSLHFQPAFKLPYKPEDQRTQSRKSSSPYQPPGPLPHLKMCYLVFIRKSNLIIWSTSGNHTPFSYPNRFSPLFSCLHGLMIVWGAFFCFPVFQFIRYLPTSVQCAYIFNFLQESGGYICVTAIPTSLKSSDPPSRSTEWCSSYKHGPID